MVIVIPYNVCVLSYLYMKYTKALSSVNNEGEIHLIGS